MRLRIINPEPKREIVGEFLVDSGAHYTVLTGDMVKKLKLVPVRVAEFELADGSMITRPLGNCIVEYGDYKVPTTVVLGQGDDGPILGVLTLEAMGLSINPLSHKLQKLKLRL